MRPLALYAYVSGIKDEATALRIERAVKRQSLSKKESQGRSPIQKKFYALLKVIRSSQCSELALTLNLFGDDEVPTELPGNVQLHRLRD